jgi:beta-glucosidase
VIAVLGHENGTFAPGIKDRRIALQVAHHLLVSHGKAVVALREAGCTLPVGIVLNLSPIEPASDSAADIAAAELGDARGRRWYTDPLFKGHYPANVLAELGSDAPTVLPGDMEVIATPIDFLGVNYYTRQVVSAAGPVDLKTLGLPLTEMGWEVYAKGLTDLLLLLHRDYKLPAVIITENGGAFKDDVVNQVVHDQDRVDYLRTHIDAVATAMEQGVPMAGYMVWSLMDNFEWSSGYGKRFGIVHVDYQTLKRTFKDSAHWYRGFLDTVRSLHNTKRRA